MISRAASVSAFLALAALAGSYGCSGSVTTPGTSESTSGGTGGTASTSAGTGGVASTSAGTGGAGDCSPSAPCPSGEACVYADHLCGQGEATGVCVPGTAMACSGPTPRCGCDGKLHPTECDAQNDGTDITLASACAAPADSFACDTLYCGPGQYCFVNIQHTAPGGACKPDVSCREIPSECGDAGDCTCFPAPPPVVSNVTCSGDWQSGWTLTAHNDC